VWAAAEACAADEGKPASTPDLVRSVTLIGPFVHDTPTSALMKLMMWLVMKNPLNVASWISYYRTLFPSRKPDDFDDYLSELRRSLRQRGRMNGAYRYGAASLAESDRRLGILSMPVLVVMGTADPDFPDPAAEARQTADETGGELHMIEGAGHYPQTEFPDQTNPLIVDFIKRAGQIGRRATAD
jgi:pimeloyl-ACP methyl ester carboxylesterase